MSLRVRHAVCASEVHSGKGAGGILLSGDVEGFGEALLSRFSGSAQMVYLDPPFNTGKRFVHRQCVGEAGWRSGKPVIELPAYTDQWESDEQLLSMLKHAAEVSYALLKEDGSLFFHIDSRMHAHTRLMLDSVFGKQNFVNEIVWVYQSGGRSTSHFSRKHDIILYYRKSPRAFFDIHAVSVPREGNRQNHMRRAVDEEGRAYRSIVSLGKEYRYYDDDSVLLSDVWTDISHIQQKDPQRSGYDTQKPLKLLERLILCATRPGDLVCDLFSGSGTTAVAAARLGRRFLALDRADVALSIARRRLIGEAMEIGSPSASGAPHIAVRSVPSLGMMAVHVEAYKMEDGLLQMDLQETQALEQLSIGTLREGVFHAYDNAVRTKAQPALRTSLDTPMLEGQTALLTVDVLGRRMLHLLEEEKDEQV